MEGTFSADHNTGRVPRGPTRPDSCVCCRLATPPSPANWLRCPSTLWRKWTEHEILTSRRDAALFDHTGHNQLTAQQFVDALKERNLRVGTPSNGSRTLCRFLGWDPANMSFAVQQQNPWWRYFTLSQVARVFSYLATCLVIAQHEYNL